MLGGGVTLNTSTLGHKSVLGSGVDGDDFTATATHQQHPLKALGQYLQELHVCRASGQRGSTRTKGHSGKFGLSIVQSWGNLTPHYGNPVRPHMLSTSPLPVSPQKDTVLITFAVLGWARHVQ